MNVSDTEKRALDALKKGNLREQTLITCRHCGMTNQTLVLLECGENIEPRLMRSTFEWLSRPTKSFPALLEAKPMRLEGRKKGRPQQAYLLTEFGKKILSLLDPPIIARMNRPKDAKDLNHRFVQLDVLTRALQNGWEAEVEKTILYQGGEIRCDIVLHRPDDSDLYIEIEQELTRNNIERAREKFRNWQAYAISRHFVPDMIFVFNLPNAKLTHTLNSWQEALGTIIERDDFSLDVRYILAGALEGKDLSETLESFSVWMEAITETDAGYGAASETLPQSAAPEVRLQSHSELLPQLHHLVDAYSAARTSADRMKAFFELMHYIHEVSYGEGSDTFKASKLPVKSLWLLKHYLTLPQNQKMYEELKQALIWLKSRGSMGLIIMRDTLCGILWDTFLAHHHLAMGGNLRVTLDVPDYSNQNSTFEVRVMFKDTKEDMKRDAHAKSLAWVMTAFLWYPEYMETGTQMWKRKGKSKG
jgi:hypothetical protein